MCATFSPIGFKISEKCVLLFPNNQNFQCMVLVPIGSKKLNLAQKIIFKNAKSLHSRKHVHPHPPFWGKMLCIKFKSRPAL
jgi:hypothetical protein